MTEHVVNEEDQGAENGEDHHAMTPPMMAKFLLTPFLMAWPCPGLYGKSALAVEEEIKSHVYHLSRII